MEKHQTIHLNIYEIIIYTATNLIIYLTHISRKRELTLTSSSFFFLPLHSINFISIFYWNKEFSHGKDMMQILKFLNLIQWLQRHYWYVLYNEKCDKCAENLHFNFHKIGRWAVLHSNFNEAQHEQIGEYKWGVLMPVLINWLETQVLALPFI